MTSRISQERMDDEALEMRLLGMTWKSIAARLEISPETAQRWSRNAARKLRRSGVVCPDLSRNTIKAFRLGMWERYDT